MFNIDEIKNEWKKLASAKQINAYDVVSLCLYRALASRSNDKLAVARGLLMSAFSPVTNLNKLDNGQKEFGSLEKALGWASRYPDRLFGHEIAGPEVLREIHDLVEQLRKETPKDEMYSYFFVRQDISNEQQMVQAAHAAMVLGQAVDWKKSDAHTTNFVIFGVPNHYALIEKADYLWKKGIEYFDFYEPDMKDQITAIACRPMRKSVADRKRLFVNETLLKMKDENSYSFSIPTHPAGFPTGPETFKDNYIVSFPTGPETFKNYIPKSLRTLFGY